LRACLLSTVVIIIIIIDNMALHDAKWLAFDNVRYQREQPHRHCSHDVRVRLQSLPLPRSKSASHTPVATKKRNPASLFVNDDAVQGSIDDEQTRERAVLEISDAHGFDAVYLRNNIMLHEATMAMNVVHVKTNVARMTVSDWQDVLKLVPLRARVYDAQDRLLFDHYADSKDGAWTERNHVRLRLRKSVPLTATEPVPVLSGDIELRGLSKRCALHQGVRAAFKRQYITDLAPGDRIDMHIIATLGYGYQHMAHAPICHLGHTPLRSVKIVRDVRDEHACSLVAACPKRVFALVDTGTGQRLSPDDEAAHLVQSSTVTDIEDLIRNSKPLGLKAVVANPHLCDACQQCRTPWLPFNPVVDRKTWRQEFAVEVRDVEDSKGLKVNRLELESRGHVAKLEDVVRRALQRWHRETLAFEAKDATQTQANSNSNNSRSTADKGDSKSSAVRMS
jgi:hypothetical protein